MPESDIDAAICTNSLPLLVVETLFQPGPNMYTIGELADRVGTSPDVIIRVRRALGFNDPDPDDEVGGDADVTAIRDLMDGTDDFRLALDRVRTAAAPMSRTAESIAGSFGVGIGRQLERGADQFTIADEVLADGDPASVVGMLQHVLRRELTHALRRLRLDRGSPSDITVVTGIGFVDLVGYTELMQGLDEAETVELIRRIEAVGHDEVARLGGSLVKMVGDGLLYRAPTPELTAEIALTLVARGGKGIVPEARAGVAWGPVVHLHGDVFGHTVNLSSRIMSVADSGTVVTAGEMAGLVPVLPPQGHHLKGIGDVAVFTLAAPERS